jgi:exodeoxyribonuclease V gamma subunit
LLQLFAQDPSLEPRDVLVMTPDIETFAPLVAAVFARHGGALKPGASEDSSPGASVLPAIPTSIADLGLSRTNPMAEVLLTLLRLAGERVTATRVFSLLSLQPVRFRFGIGDDDLGALQDLIRASGLRWGLDADDRSAAGQPRSDQNTLRFAAERLALGVLMADEDPLGVVQGEDTNLGPSVPLDAQGTQAVDHAGTLLTLLRVLRVHRAALAGPASIAAWRGCLLQALDALADTSDSSAWLRSEVVDALDVLAQQAAPLGDVAVERAALVKWLAGGFEVSQRGDRPITGAVTVCALQPMRSVPFRVVALLGMDDKAFPRGGRAKTWDPFERRRAGERDGRETDRHLLLEAMLSARERLLLFWSGHGVDNGKAQAAAVPVEELLEVVGALTVRKRAALVQEHPLQPWSEGNFAPDATSHDAALASAAEQLRELRAGSREPARPNFFRDRSVTLPEEPEPIRVLSVDDLAWALYGPQKVLLKDRLGLTVTVGNDGLEDREPLDLEGIDNDAITLRVLTALQAGASAMQPTQLAARLGARLAGEGHRPLRPDVAAVLQTRVDSAHETRAQAEGVRGTPHGPLELAWTGRGGLQLVGRVADVRAHEGRLLLQWTTTYSAASAPSQLAAFAHLLVAHAMRLPVIGARILSPGMPATPGHAAGVFLALPSDVHGTPEVAALLLDDLMAIYASMRRRALPLFPRTSLNVAMVLHASDDDLDAPGTLDRLRAEAENAWAGRPPKLRGDGQDPWIARIFDGYDPCNDLSPSADGLLDLARRVWLPILRAHDAGDALSTMLAPISTPEGVPG